MNSALTTLVMTASLLLGAAAKAQAAGAPPAPDANWDANNCEYYVNALGYQSRHYGGGGYDERTLITYVSVNERDLVFRQGGQILRVGMLANGEDWILGRRVEPAYYRIDLTLYLLKPNHATVDYRLFDFLYFIDVKRADGTVDRLWLKDGGTHFQWPSVYENYPKHWVSLGSSYEAWVKEPSPVLNQKSACAR